MKSISRYSTILLILSVVFLPVKSQNTGPVAPEAMAFEPVDAANMVNLNTGDFVYSLPILNIPGPGGGYPLALSYHGGIGMDQEASWVGLGWNINPGAINRGVIGYPDDMSNGKARTIINGAEGSYTTRHVGTSFSYKGLNFGNSLTWNSNWSQWTFTNYVGLGVGDASINAGFTTGTEFGVSAGVGKPVGGKNKTTLGASISAGTMGVYASVGIGPLSVNYNFTTEEASIGFSDGSMVNITGTAKNPGLGFKVGMGISLSSDGNISGGLSAGASSYSTAQKASVSAEGIYTVHSSWYVPAVFFSLGYDNIRYWQFDKQTSNINGMLYLSDSYQPSTDRDAAIIDDSYVSDAIVMPYAYEEKLDPTTSETFANLMLPGYDQFSVNAQGLNGNMQLKYYEPSLLVGQSKVLESFGSPDPERPYDHYKREILYYNTAGFADRNKESCILDQDQLMKQMTSEMTPYFYFQNSPSSSIQVAQLEFTFHDENEAPDPLWGDYSIDPVDNTAMKSTTGTVKENRKANGNYVEFFTNKDITDNFNLCVSKGFIETSSIVSENERANPEYFSEEGIGAFSITSNDGITYHYSLPVYQFEEYKVHEDRTFGSDDFYLHIQEEPYAYTWLLTAITGPDFVDKGEKGYLDDSDEGYWVKFEYGKWTDAYFWLLPYNQPAEEYQMGRKQIYYLNKVETKTHEAIFVKAEREDGLSARIDKTFTGSSRGYRVSEIGEHIGWQKNVKILESGWNIDYYKMFYKKFDCGLIDNHYIINTKEVAPLRLEKILLIDKKQEHNLKENLSDWSTSESFSIAENSVYNTVMEVTNSLVEESELPDEINVADLYDYLSYDMQFGEYERLRQLGIVTDETNQFTLPLYYDENVIDINDYTALTSNLEVVKEIDFIYDTDNALCQNAPNSPNGKLTLAEVAFKSSKRANTIPPYRFSYYRYDNNYNSHNADLWGFHEDYADNWSLAEISTPTGAKLAVEYAADSYYKEAIFNGIHEEELVDIYQYTNPTTTSTRATYICTLPEGYTYDQLFSLNQEYYTTCEFVVTTECEGICFVQNPFNPGTFTQYPRSLSEDKSYKESRGYTVRPGSTDREFILELEYEAPGCDWDAVFDWGGQCFKTEKLPTNYACTLNKLTIRGVKVKDVTNGGGVRVERISVITPEETITTNYDYTKPNSTQTSGVTSYAPGHETEFIPLPTELPAPCVYYGYVTVSNEQGETTYAFETPSSSTNHFDTDFRMGEHLETENTQMDIDITNPFVEIDAYEDLPLYPVVKPKHSKVLLARSAIIKNRTSRIGRSLSVKTRNKYGDLLNSKYFKYNDGSNAIGVNQETFYYLKNALLWLKTDHTRSQNKFYLVSTTLKKEPSVLESVHSTDGNLTSSVFYSDFDPITGQALKTTEITHLQSPETIDEISDITTVKSYYWSDMLPAYEILNYAGEEDGNASNAGMGSKVLNPHNKNMLVQTAATMNYKRISGVDRTMGVTINTWSNDWENTYLEWNTTAKAFEYDGNDKPGSNIWRKHKTFAWNGSVRDDGSYGDDFNSYTNLDVLRDNWGTYFGRDGYDKWLKTTEITRYDHNSTPVEILDLNDDYAATKKDPSSTYTIATSANSTLASFTATSFEYFEKLGGSGSTFPYHYGGELVDLNGYSSQLKSTDAPYGTPGTSFNGIKAHTGHYYLKVNSGQSGPRYFVKQAYGLITDQKYRASVWRHSQDPGTGNIQVKISGATVSGLTPEIVGTYGEWELITLDFMVPSSASSLEIALTATGGDAYFDDFRISPYNAAVKSYTYDKNGNISAIINNNNFATKYYYDHAGHLIRTDAETKNGFKKVVAHEYSFAEVFGVSPSDRQEYTAKRQTKRFSVRCEDSNWSVSGLPSWLTVNKANNYFDLEIDENSACVENREARTANITITSSTGETVTIPIYQEARKRIFLNTVLDDAEFDAGDEITLNWDQCQVSPGVKIEIYYYSYESTPTPDLVCTLTDSFYDPDGLFISSSFTIPEYGDENVYFPWSSSSLYKLRITYLSDESIYDESGFFSVSP